MTVEADNAAGAGAKTPPRVRLGNLPTRQRVTGEKAAARTRLVRRLRIALPVLALSLVGVLFLNAREDAGDPAFLDDFAAADVSLDANKTATKPSFAGIDDKGRPYEITAETASQQAGADDVVDLVKPRAQTRAGDDDTFVTADKGVYRKDENELDLSDAVTLEHQIGKDTYVLTTPSAKVSIQGQTVESTAGVEGAGKSGSLRADRMRAYNAEGRVVFEGNVSMRFDPKSTDQAAQAAKPGKAPQ